MLSHASRFTRLCFEPTNTYQYIHIFDAFASRSLFYWCMEIMKSFLTSCARVTPNPVPFALHNSLKSSFVVVVNS